MEVTEHVQEDALNNFKRSPAPSSLGAPRHPPDHRFGFVFSPATTARSLSLPISSSADCSRHGRASQGPSGAKARRPRRPQCRLHRLRPSVHGLRCAAEDRAPCRLQIHRLRTLLRTLVAVAAIDLLQTSDVGEAFRPVVHPAVVTAAYGVSWLYLTGFVKHVLVYPVSACPDIAFSPPETSDTRRTRHTDEDLALLRPQLSRSQPVCRWSPSNARSSSRSLRCMSFRRIIARHDADLHVHL